MKDLKNRITALEGGAGSALDGFTEAQLDHLERLLGPYIHDILSLPCSVAMELQSLGLFPHMQFPDTGCVGDSLSSSDAAYVRDDQLKVRQALYQEPGMRHLKIEGDGQ